MKKIKFYMIVVTLLLAGCSEISEMTYTSVQFEGFNNTCLTNTRVVNVSQVGDSKTFTLTCKVHQ